MTVKSLNLGPKVCVTNDKAVEILIWLRLLNSLSEHDPEFFREQCEALCDEVADALPKYVKLEFRKNDGWWWILPDDEAIERAVDLGEVYLVLSSEDAGRIVPGVDSIVYRDGKYQEYWSGGRQIWYQ